MAPSETAYTSAIISMRSRRLRTIASVLLCFLTLITVFGASVLMPSLRRNVSRYKTIQAQVAELGVHQPAAAVHKLERSILPGQKITMVRAAKSVRTQVLFMYGYWGFTVLLLLSVILCVWMDLREISRQYTEHKIKMVAAAASDAVQSERRGRENRDDP